MPIWENCRSNGGRAWSWVTAVAFLAALAPPSVTNAETRIPGPDEPPPEEEPPSCIPAATGSIRANPSVLDLRLVSPYDQRVTTRLSWSTTVTRNCASFRGFMVNFQSVAHAGSLDQTFTLPGTYRYTLKIRIANGTPITIATTTVHVLPDVVTISNGRNLASDDIQTFHARWMVPGQLSQFLEFTRGHLSDWDTMMVWGIGDRMRAMVRMYEITGDQRYLDHLRDLIEIVLAYRDDHYPGRYDLDPFQPERTTPMPAWGMSSPANAWYWRTSSVVAAVYSYPIAAFARIVAENPALHATYGESALSYTNAVMDTFEAYLGSFHNKFVGGTNHAYMIGSPAASTILSYAKCDRAYDEARAMGWDDPSRLESFHRQCIDAVDYPVTPDRPEPNNVIHAMLMMTMELYRAVDSAFYRQSAVARWEAPLVRVVIPKLVRDSQSFFRYHLSVVNDTRGPRYVWDYMVNSFRPHREDTSHGALSMRYISLLWENKALLDAALGPDQLPIPLYWPDLGYFSRTFLHAIYRGEHLAHDVTGRAESPIDLRDSECDGWIDLAQADPRVYEACAAITLRGVETSPDSYYQPYLTPGNHAALLWSKRFRAP